MQELFTKPVSQSRQGLVNGTNFKVFPKQTSLSPTNNPGNDKVEAQDQYSNNNEKQQQNDLTPEIQNNNDQINQFQNKLDNRIEAQVMPQGDSLFLQYSKKKNEKENFIKIDRVMRAKGVKISYPFFIIPTKSLFKLIWDTIVLMLILWIAMFLPWQIVYPEDQIPVLDIVILVFFVLDILINLRTTYYDDENEEVIDTKMIIKNYVYSVNFMIDILSAFPISELYSGSNQQIIKILNLIKITRLLRLGRIFKLLQNENLKLVSMFINYLFQFLLLFHWINCLWMMLVFDQTNKDFLQTSNAWIPVNLRFVYGSANQKQLLNLVNSFYNDPEQYSKATQYIFSYYSLIMVILGSDIQPVTLGQQYYINGVGIIGSISLAILFGKISLILQKAYQISYKQQSLEDEIQTMMVKNKLPDKMQERALEYFEYCWKRRLIFDKSSRDFSEFSSLLMNECLLYIHAKLIRNVPIFSELQNQEIIAISLALKTLVFMPGELVCEIGEISNEMYFIIEGQVERKYIDDFAQSEIKILKKGDYYGEISLLTVSVYSEQLSSIGFSILESFTRFDYQKLKLKYPSLEQNMQKSLLRKRLALQEKVYSSEIILIQYNSTWLRYQVFQFFKEFRQTYQKYCWKNIQKINSFKMNQQSSSQMIGTNLYILSSMEMLITVYHQDFARSKSYRFFYVIRNKNIIEDLDDYINFNEQQGFVKYSSQSQYLEFQNTLGKYDIFGFLNSNEDEVILSDLYYVCSTACYFGVITNKLFQKMKLEDHDLYQMIKTNLLVLEEGLKQGRIENDDQEHFIKFHRVSRQMYNSMTNEDQEEILRLNEKIIEVNKKIQEQNEQILKLENWMDSQFTKQANSKLHDEERSRRMIIF